MSIAQVTDLTQITRAVAPQRSQARLGDFAALMKPRVCRSLSSPHWSADAVRRSEIKWIGVRHEEGAALAATGQAKLYP